MNWEPIHNQYRGQWVALDDDETSVVGNGETPQIALQTAKKNGYDDPIMARMPIELVSLVGSV